MKLQRAGNNISELGFICDLKINEKISRSSETLVLQRTLHNAFSPSLFLGRGIEEWESSSRSRELSTRVGRERTEIAMPARGFDSRRISTAMKLLRGA